MSRITMRQPAAWLSRFRRKRDEMGPALAARQALAKVANLPSGTDWLWRPGVLAQEISPACIIGPASGHRLEPCVALWHDCPEAALTVRQSPTGAAAGQAPQALWIETQGFGGNYLSLSVDLPPEALHRLSQSHILRAEIGLTVDHRLPVFGRLNVLHGPNTETILRDIRLDSAAQAGRPVVEFDMAGTDLNENRLEKIWLDLIFERPGANLIRICEMILSRHLRANF